MKKDDSFYIKLSFLSKMWNDNFWYVASFSRKLILWNFERVYLEVESKSNEVNWIW